MLKIQMPKFSETSYFCFRASGQYILTFWARERSWGKSSPMLSPKENLLPPFQKILTSFLPGTPRVSTLSYLWGLPYGFIDPLWKQQWAPLVFDINYLLPSSESLIFIFKISYLRSQLLAIPWWSSSRHSVAHPLHQIQVGNYVFNSKSHQLCLEAEVGPSSSY